jgi:hypothetical protein
MGRPHRPTGPDAESLRTQARLGNTPGGRTPLPPEPRHQGILRPLECGHVALIPRAPNLGALRHLCPAPPMHGRLHPETEPLLAPHQPLGVFPLSLVSLPREEEGEERGEEGCAAARALPRRPERRSGTRAGAARTGAAVPWRRELCESKEPKPRERRRREHLRRRE